MYLPYQCCMIVTTHYAPVHIGIPYEMSQSGVNEIDRDGKSAHIEHRTPEEKKRAFFHFGFDCEILSITLSLFLSFLFLVRLY